MTFEVWQVTEFPDCTKQRLLDKREGDPAAYLRQHISWYAEAYRKQVGNRVQIRPMNQGGYLLSDLVLVMSAATEAQVSW